MTRLRAGRLLLLATLLAPTACAPAAEPAAYLSAPAATRVGPVRGSLVVAGGGVLEGTGVLERFVELAGGPDAPIVVIPTAGEAREYGSDWSGLHPLREAGARNLVVLHTRDRGTADSEAFVAPLRAARGVWFPGGRQGRLADAYLDTRTHRELEALLARGGVVGGSSAGASIQASYLVRGDPEGNHIVMSDENDRGFGFLRDSAVDQHLTARHRERDLLKVLAAHPRLLGIGIDEGTAIVVQGDRFEVVGRNRVAVYDGSGAGEGYFFLSAGDGYHMGRRRVAGR